ncbi:DUF4124 domain-containing protein [Pseudoteredinibacter isoporae]|uniref:DUF4124 domain-containing protein n=1 Tax=Pseudoteredinibacter isoporae TaxID=570281 RepID=A0A7X0JTQ2_9GAMM|nr:DUF4124 domain-containing protein [Pseudoteredinibacter isoporae]MBB6522084.1 hypothetical protein [Pseudoteredinibacter isoporae]NHO87619.1 DUF4124 domain-containing protein [Pseudoteredinibacter isoporae]NIB24050.1 DUF4124 domain-containing protein [Pseudoteredinibacter isoporae]
MNPATLQHPSPAFFHRPFGHIICALSLFIASLETQAQIYRWQDESGKFQYSDKPRPGATLIKEAEEKPAEVLEALPAQQQEQQTDIVQGEGKEALQQDIASKSEDDSDIVSVQPAPQSTVQPKEVSSSMSESDQARLKELSRKHRRCASSRTRMSKLQTQFQQRKLEGAPEQTLDYLQRSIARQDKLVSRDCS